MASDFRSKEAGDPFEVESARPQRAGSAGVGAQRVGTTRSTPIAYWTNRYIPPPFITPMKDLPSAWLVPALTSFARLPGRRYIWTAPADALDPLGRHDLLPGRLARPDRWRRDERRAMERDDRSMDAEALANQLLGVGAGYCQISIGQNSGYYPFAEPDLRPAGWDQAEQMLAPGPGGRPGRRAPSAGHPADGLSALRAPGGDRVASEKLSYHRGPDRNREFQVKWEQV